MAVGYTVLTGIELERHHFDKALEYHRKALSFKDFEIYSAIQFRLHSYEQAIRRKQEEETKK